MKLRITSSCIVSGEHAEAGSIVDVDKAEAEILLGAGRAVIHREAPAAPAAPVIETASAPPAPETAAAVAKPAKSKKV